ncbi:MAG: SpoIIE family protein phosphatase [Victivallales bacterium]|nr:SpoIIE family protein phosphatase [Victivallales bacterium]
MHIDAFWIVLTVVLYALAIVSILFSESKRRLLGNMLVDALHKKAEIGNFINSFSKTLRSGDEIDNSMRATAQYVADLIGASSVCVFVFDDDCLVASGVAGAFPPLHSTNDYVFTKPRYILDSLKQEKIPLGKGLIGEVAQSGEALLIENASDDPRFANSPIQVDTFMAVPMVAEGQVAGVVCAVNNSHTGRGFTPEQFSAFKFMAGQVMMAHTIVKVYSNLTKQQRISQELSFARQIQASLIPESAPENEDFGIYAFTRSAKEVGGDFYDFVQVDKDRLLVVVGDSCGKGIPACMLMAMARSFIRASAERFTTLHDLVKGLNGDLFRDTGEDSFVTLACCLIDSREKTVEYARAGHTEMLVARHGHPVRKIYPDGAACGLLPSDIAGNYDMLSFSLLSDMSILLFSDGITESLDEDGNEFGLDALVGIFDSVTSQSTPPGEIVDKIIRDVDEFAGDVPQVDDQTLVLIASRMNGQSVSFLPSGGT